MNSKIFFCNWLTKFTIFLWPTGKFCSFFPAINQWITWFFPPERLTNFTIIFSRESWKNLVIVFLTIDWWICNFFPATDWLILQFFPGTDWRILWGVLFANNWQILQFFFCGLLSKLKLSFHMTDWRIFRLSIQSTDEFLDFFHVNLTNFPASDWRILQYSSSWSNDEIYDFFPIIYRQISRFFFSPRAIKVTQVSIRGKKKKKQNSGIKNFKKYWNSGT